MKVISAHQPGYLPWLGFFHKVILSDEFVFMDDVQFEKNSFINRNKILINGNPTILTIPVVTKDYTNKQLREIEIVDDRWKLKHLRSIEQSYKKYPFYMDVFPIIENMINKKSNFLIDYLTPFILDVVNYLQIKTPISLASDLSISSKKLDYVIELTRKLNGDAFLFGALGKNYADEEKLSENNVIPLFQDYIHPEYKQNNDSFVPFLSIVDLLMNYGTNATEKLLEGNILRNSLELKNA